METLEPAKSSNLWTRGNLYDTNPFQNTKKSQKKNLLIKSTILKQSGN